MAKKIRNCDAFTLIEMSIVLVIMGFIAASILVGKDLVFSAQIRSQIADLEAIDRAVLTFREKYGCLPGDCSNTVARGIAPSVGAGWDGNDNGLIEEEYLLTFGLTPGFFETANFWTHLLQSGLTTGYEARKSGTAAFHFGTNSPTLIVDAPNKLTAADSPILADEGDVVAVNSGVDIPSLGNEVDPGITNPSGDSNAIGTAQLDSVNPLLSSTNNGQIESRSGIDLVFFDFERNGIDASAPYASMSVNSFAMAIDSNFGFPLPAIRPDIAYAMDEKMDDGLPSSGKLRGKNIHLYSSFESGNNMFTVSVTQNEEGTASSGIAVMVGYPPDHYWSQRGCVDGGVTPNQYRVKLREAGSNCMVVYQGSW